MNRITRNQAALCFVVLAVWLLAAGCGSTSVGARLVLPPTTIVGDPHGLRGDIYDAYELFDRGEEAFVQAQWPRAQVLYERLLREYPQSDIAPMARYNLALVNERQGNWGDALAVYEGFGMPPGKGVRLEEVRLRKGICLSRLKRWDEAQAVFESVLRQFGVPPLEYNEARVRLGIAAFHNEREVLAEHYLSQALAQYEINAERGVAYARAAFGQGYFVMGEIYFRRFEQVELAGDTAMLSRSLREKAEAFVIAREHYTRAIRTYEPGVVVSSLFRIGMGYELFYRTVLAAPDPAELTANERRAYRDKLAEKLKPLLDKALAAYRRNLDLAQQMNVSGSWVEQTQKRYRDLSDFAQQAP
ncbi:MAG: tetratricopeptide repeat protein [Candidatus Lernaella stagnicola]|nr:tetratricopeptide repeat protein [Candidatus Lernaella stagnicola]